MKRIKGIVISAAGSLLLLVYLMGVIGYDVHVDRHEGRTYVVSLLSDTSCEKIHPEDVCSCCEHHLHHEANPENCICPQEDDCQDIAEFLEITGDGSDTQHQDFAPIVGPVFSAAALSLGGESFGDSPMQLQFRHLRFSSPREHLSRICILRV